MVTLHEIKQFFENYEFKNQYYELSKCERIFDLEKFVKAHINTLEGNSGKAKFLPYFLRLEKIYNILKNG